MPDETIITPAPVETPAPVASAPAPTPREQVISKYEAMYAEPPAQSTPAAVVVPVPTEPIEPAAPAQPDLSTALAALMTEVTEMRQQLKAAQTPPPPTPTPGEQESWLKLLADGKQSEGEKKLAEVLGPQIQQAAVQQALSLMQAERDVNEFTAQIKAANPDLLAFESYITLGAQNRIAAGQAAGAIKSPADYVTVYKAAVSAEIENARKLTQSLRGAGKIEGQTRISEVMASPTLQPSAITNREAAAPKQDQLPSPEQITQDYFAERKARQARLAGMAV